MDELDDEGNTYDSDEIEKLDENELIDENKTKNNKLLPNEIQHLNFTFKRNRTKWNCLKSQYIGYYRCSSTRKKTKKCCATLNMYVNVDSNDSEIKTNVILKKNT